jgi:hypothetical protein
MNPTSPLYPSMKKKTKNEENKVLYQNVFFKKLKGLITSQKKGIKIYFTNKFESATYITHAFHLSPMSFNSTLSKKKTLN